MKYLLLFQLDTGLSEDEVEELLHELGREMGKHLMNDETLKPLVAAEICGDTAVTIQDQG